MTYHFTPMTAVYAQAIANWHYEGDYTFYDMDQDPGDLEDLLDPANWPDAYFAVLNAAGELVGFFVFSQDGDTVEVGLGLGPAFTGQGLGESFVLAGLAFARQRYCPCTFRLRVAQFNQRAIRVYEKAGFTRGKTYQQATNGDVYKFICMECPA